MLAVLPVVAVRTLAACDMSSLRPSSQYTNKAREYSVSPRLFGTDISSLVSLRINECGFVYAHIRVGVSDHART